MKKLNTHETMPDFEASPVRRPHSYEASDFSSMAATPRAKPSVTVQTAVNKPMQERAGKFPNDRSRGPVEPQTPVGRGGGMPNTDARDALAPGRTRMNRFNRMR